MTSAISLIAAVSRNLAIGKDNALLWRLPEDLQFFKRTTMGCPIVMGRKTYDSIGRPLPGRRNIVVTRNTAWHAEGVETAPSLREALALAAQPDAHGQRPSKVFVIGGAQVYAQTLPLADELILTEVDCQADGDAFFPAFDRQQFQEVAREAFVGPAPEALAYSRVVYRRIA